MVYCHLHELWRTYEGEGKDGIYLREKELFEEED